MTVRQINDGNGFSCVFLGVGPGWGGAVTGELPFGAVIVMWAVNTLAAM